MSEVNDTNAPVEKHNKWTVIGPGSTPLFRMCRCACGNEREVNVKNLRAGLSKSCGWCPNDRTKHGLSKSRTYGIWKGMHYRVKNNLQYIRNGATVCVRWSGKSGFINFVADMGEAPPDLSIDRGPDNKKGYWCGKPECSECGPLKREPNCAWATDETQQRNQDRRKLYEYNGKSQCIAAWAEEYGLNQHTLHARISRGHTLEEALMEPVKEQRGKGAPKIKNRMIEFDGRVQSVEDWSIEFGLRLNAMIDRLNHGWSMERIKNTPGRRRRSDSKQETDT